MSLPRPECGTRRGYFAHRRRLEDTCQPCKDAHNRYRRERYQPRPRKVASIDTAKCGTSANYIRHIRLGEEPCGPCREARRQYDREYNKSRPKPPPRERPIPEFNPAKCGSTAGVAQHRRFKVPICRACRFAEGEYRRRRAKHKAPVARPRLELPAWFLEDVKREVG